MSLKYEAKQFLENCRVVKKGEIVEKGIVVFFDKEEKKFEFKDYTTKASKEPNSLGVIYLKDILDDSDCNVTILAFRKRAREIVGKRYYKLHEEAKNILDHIPVATSLHVLLKIMAKNKEDSAN